MRAKPLASYVAFLAALVFTLSGCVERTESPPRPSEPIGPIWGPHVAGQTFTPRNRRLVGVDVQFATYARTNQGTVTLRLMDGSPPLREPIVEVPAAALRDNAMYRFRFEAVRPSVMRGEQPTWSFSIQSSAASAADAITVWTSASDVVPKGSATYDGQPRDADLVFTPVYEESLPLALATQIEGFVEAWPGPLVLLALVFLPGLLLAQLCLSRAVHGFGLQVAAAPAFGLAAAPLLTLYATVAGARLSAAAVWVLLGGSAVGILAIELVRRLRSPAPRVGRADRGTSRHRDWSVAIALAVTLAGLMARGIALEDGSVPPGADTYHHALIAQLFADRGQVPTSYRPYAEIDSFSYHFGFHALAGLDALATGAGGLPAVAAVAPLVSVLPSLSTFFLVRAAGLGRAAAIVAAVVLALVDPFPVALLDIGRYPQQAALAIFPVAVAFALGYTADPALTSRRLGLARAIFGAAILAAGLFLTHYRVILYLAVVLTFYTVWTLVRAVRVDRGLMWPTVRLPLALSIVALVLCAPWVARLAEGFSLGLRGSEGRYAPAYYAIDRLGDALAHPAIPFLGALALLGVLLAAVTRQRLVLLLAVVFAAQLALSNPHWLPLPGAGWVDTVTVVSSAFVPVAVAVGFLLSRVNDVLVSRLGHAAAAIVPLVVAAAAFWGALQLTPLVQPGHRLVQSADLSAADWIKDRLAPDARFLVETFVLRWNPDFVAPTDAGYFLPLLAHRQTTLLPMVYPAERGVPAGGVERMEAIARATAENPSSAETLTLLRGAGVTHVYLGVRRGSIPEHQLATSPVFRRVYQEGGVSIYELLPSPVG